MARKEFTEQEMDRLVRLIERRRAVLKLKAEDFYKKAGITERTFLKAKADNSMTEATYAKLLAAMGLSDDADEIRSGVFQEDEYAEEPPKRSLLWPVLIGAVVVVVVVFGSVCSLSNVCRPPATSAFDDEYAGMQIQTDYFLRVTHNGRYTDTTFLGPAITMPEQPAVYFDSGPQLSGPVDVSIGIFDRVTGDTLKTYELEGQVTDYRQPYFDSRTTIRSVDIEIVECLAYHDGRLDAWVKQFRVLHPDAERLSYQVSQEKYGDLEQIAVFSTDRAISSRPATCDADPRNEDAYNDYLEAGVGEPLINYDPNSLQPRKLEDIGYALLGWQGHCISIQAADNTKAGQFTGAYELVFRNSDGDVVPAHGLCFVGEDKFTVEFVPRSEGTQPLEPIVVEGLFDMGVQRDLGTLINTPGGRSALISCSTDACAMVDAAVNCFSIPPTVTVSRQAGPLFRMVLPNCLANDQLPQFRCYSENSHDITLDEMKDWEVLLEYASGRTAFLKVQQIEGQFGFADEFRVDFPC